MALVTMHTTRWCPYCIAARRLLNAEGVPFDVIDVSASAALRREMERQSGRHTVPQIWIGSRHVGGFDDLEQLQSEGLLRQWLDSAAQERLTNKANH